MHALTTLWKSLRERYSAPPAPGTPSTSAKPGRSGILPRTLRPRGRVTPDLNDQFELLDDDIVPAARSVPTAPPAAPLPGYRVVRNGEIWMIEKDELI